PFPFPPPGESRGGRVPPTPEARYRPAKNAGPHRCCRLPPQEGLPPPCGSPVRSSNRLSVARALFDKPDRSRINKTGQLDLLTTESRSKRVKRVECRGID